MWKLFVATAAVLVATGCETSGKLGAAPLPAPAVAADPGAFREEPISANRWRLKFTGKPGQTEAEVKALALRRAAQSTLDHGGQWFEIVSGDAAAKRRNAIATDFGPAFKSVRTCAADGCTAVATPKAGGPAVVERSFEILIGKGETLAGGGARHFEAKDVLRGKPLS